MDIFSNSNYSFLCSLSLLSFDERFLKNDSSQKIFSKGFADSPFRPSHVLILAGMGLGIRCGSPIGSCVRLSWMMKDQVNPMVLWTFLLRQEGLETESS